MSQLVLPENVLDATGSYVDPEQAAQDTLVMLEWNRLIKDLDPRLSFHFVPPQDPTKPTMWPKDQRWYLVRRNELVADSFWVVEDEQGEYCTFSRKHYDKFREMDTHRSPHVWREFRKREEARLAAVEKRTQEKRREFREKLLERLEFNDTTTIAVTPEMKERLAGGRKGGDAGLEPRPDTG